MKSKRSKVPKHKKGAWYVSVRGSYLPVSWQGWLLYIPYIVLIVLGLLWVSNMLSICSASEGCNISNIAFTLFYSLLFLVPYFVALIAVMHWIAKQKS